MERAGVVKPWQNAQQVSLDAMTKEDFGGEWVAEDAVNVDRNDR